MLVHQIFKLELLTFATIYFNSTIEWRIYENFKHEEDTKIEKLSFFSYSHENVEFIYSDCNNVKIAGGKIVLDLKMTSLVFDEMLYCDNTFPIAPGEYFMQVQYRKEPSDKYLSIACSQKFSISPFKADENYDLMQIDNEYLGIYTRGLYFKDGLPIGFVVQNSQIAMLSESPKPRNKALNNETILIGIEEFENSLIILYHLSNFRSFELQPLVFCPQLVKQDIHIIDSKFYGIGSVVLQLESPNNNMIPYMLIDALTLKPIKKLEESWPVLPNKMIDLTLNNFESKIEAGKYRFLFKNDNSRLASQIFEITDILTGLRISIKEITENNCKIFVIADRKHLEDVAQWDAFLIDSSWQKTLLPNVGTLLMKLIQQDQDQPMEINFPLNADIETNGWYKIEIQELVKPKSSKEKSYSKINTYRSDSYYLDLPQLRTNKITVSNADAAIIEVFENAVDKSLKTKHIIVLFKKLVMDVSMHISTKFLLISDSNWPVIYKGYLKQSSFFETIDNDAYEAYYIEIEDLVLHNRVVFPYTEIFERIINGKYRLKLQVEVLDDTGVPIYHEIDHEVEYRDGVSHKIVSYAISHSQIQIILPNENDIVLPIAQNAWVIDKTNSKYSAKVSSWSYDASNNKTMFISYLPSTEEKNFLVMDMNVKGEIRKVGISIKECNKPIPQDDICLLALNSTQHRNLFG